MMSRNALEGKPNAGKPQARLGTEEAVPARPRQESWFRRRAGAVLLALAVAGMWASAFGGSFHIKDGVSDWTSAASYTEAGAPSSGDIVILPTNVTVYLNASSDAASLALVNSLDKINFAGDDSRLEISVTGTDVKEVAIPMTAYRFDDRVLPSYKDYTGGPIVKTGPGTLILSSNGKVLQDNIANFDYYSTIIVEEGSLKVNPAMGSPCYRSQLGRVRVEEGAYFFPSCCAWHNGTTYIFGLSGGGTVTNEPCGYLDDLVFKGTVANGDTSDFSGQLNGVYHGLYFTAGDAQTISGTNSWASVSSGVALYAGAHARLAGLGISSTSPSAVGIQKDAVYTYIDQPLNTELEIVGDSGATFNQGIVFESTTNSVDRMAVIINAGAKGGHTFTGTWQRRYTSQGGKSLVLRGDNAEPEIIACNVSDNHNTTSESGRGHSIYISKEGTGTWRFDNRARTSFASGISVNEGVLEYETIAPAGMACSIGVATNLTDGQWGIADTNAEHRVDYAIRLGAPLLDGTSKTSGRFSYIGATRGSNPSRKIAIAGAGGIRSNASSGGIVHGDVYGISSDPMSLYLDGDNATDDNIVAKISDGTVGGKVTVVKEGTGKWHVGPASDFSGGIDVRGGELVLDPAKYSWYRWTIMDHYPQDAANPYPGSWRDANTGTKYLTFYEFALYDKDGYNQVENYQTNTRIGRNEAEIPFMEPGTAEMFAYGGNWLQSQGQKVTVDGVESNYYMDVWKAFDLKTTAGYGVWGVRYKLYNKSNSEIRINGSSDPDTRVAMVIRLKPGANDVVSYDYMNTYGGYSAEWPTAIRNAYLDASVDGVHWERLHTSTDAPVHYDGGMWAFQGSYTDGEATHATRAPDSLKLTSPRLITNSPVLSATPSASACYAADSVKISGGGKLTVAGGASALTIRSLEVDAQTGGTIDGATLDPSLALSIVNIPKVDAMELPVTFTNVEGLANVSGWTVTYDGRFAGAWFVEVRDGKLSIFKRGMVLIVK